MSSVSERYQISPAIFRSQDDNHVPYRRTKVFPEKFEDYSQQKFQDQVIKVVILFSKKNTFWSFIL